tara:strand:+ start:9371 stop:9598 length:228 start_codon:yes stop_codon:yes gene_type:complete
MDTKDNNNITIQLSVSDELLNKVLRALVAPPPSPMGGGMPIPMSLLSGLLGQAPPSDDEKSEEKPTVGFKIKGAK